MKNLSRFFPAFALLLFFALPPVLMAQEGGSPANCANGIDDDSDGLIDAFDTECACVNTGYGGLCTPACGFTFGSGLPSIQLRMTSAADVPNYFTPVVGDVDNDGVTEIVALSSTGSTTADGAARPRSAQNILIINGKTGVTESTIPTPYIPWVTPGAILIANVDADPESEIIIATAYGTANASLSVANHTGGFAAPHNSYLYCYNHDGTIVWKSSQQYGYGSMTQRSGGALGITDFNEDGVPEVYIYNQVFNATTGAFLCEGGNTNGMGGAQANSWGTVATSVAADLVPSAAGLELAAGRTVYTFDAALTTMTAIQAPASRPDGCTAITDINQDGLLDVVVSAGTTNADNFYIWNPSGTPTNLASVTVGTAGTSNTPSQPFIADIDNDCEPELGICRANRLFMYEYNGTATLQQKWQLSTSDASGFTGLTMFDFNQDNKVEIIYRDQTLLRIIDGSTATPVDITTFPCVSGTGAEMPTVADLDGNGQSEICVPCNTAANDIGKIYVFHSPDAPWAPARAVWNQYAYHIFNVNDNLSVPQHINRNSAPSGTAACTGSPLCPTGNRPYNNFVTQATRYTQSGCPIYSSSDANISITSVSLTCPSSLQVNWTINNLGTLDNIPVGMPITFYSGDPTSSVAPAIATVLTTGIVPASGSLAGSTVISTIGVSAFYLYAVVNDDAQLTRPFSLSAFPVTPIAECNYLNNLSAGRFVQGCPDKDGDGISDALDLDDDNDGLPDAGETCLSAVSATDYSCLNAVLHIGGTGTDPSGDADADGTPNFLDATPGGGITNTCTDGDADGVCDAMNPLFDADGDGIANFYDLDTDNDGIPDLIEAGGIDSNGDGRADVVTDADGDGWSNLYDNNGLGTLLQPDADQDGVPNNRDLDSDNDGITDLVEFGGSDVNGDGRTDLLTDNDNDGFADVYDSDDDGAAGIDDTNDPLVKTAADAGGDGLRTSENVTSGDGTTSRDPDSDRIPNAYDLDADNDGIPDLIEAGGADANGDGVVDSYTDGADADGYASTYDPDDTNDGVMESTTQPLVRTTTDSNSNGRVNGTENVTGGNGTTTTGTDNDGDFIPDWLDLDTDNDGIADIIEAGGVDADGNGRADNTTDGTDADGFVSIYDPNDDNDGTTEDATQPLVRTGADTGADGKITTEGFTTGSGTSLIDPDGDLLPNFADLDSDKDGITDAMEANAGTLPGGMTSQGRVTTLTDTNADGWQDAFDGPGVTSAASGLLVEASADGNSDGKANEGYLAADDFDSDKRPDLYDIDADNDGIIDADEAQASNSTRLPAGLDTDGDGIDNSFDPDNGGTSVTAPINTDGLTTADYLDLDSDNDGSYDWIEGFESNDGDVDALEDYRTKITLWRASNCGVHVACAAYDNTPDADGDGYPAWADQNEASATNNQGTSFLPPFLNPANASYYFDSDGDGLADLYDGVGGTASTEPASGVSTRSAAAPAASTALTPDYRNSVVTVTFPIEWGDFTALPAGNDVSLKWEALLVATGDLFRVQRSTNGIDYESISTLEATPQSGTSYSFADAGAMNSGFPVLYYRIQYLGINGDLSVTEVRSVTPNTAFAVRTFTDPSGTLNITVSGQGNTPVALRITDLTGRLVWSLQPQQLSTVQVSSREWAGGIYLLEAVAGKQFSSQKIRVE